MLDVHLFEMIVIYNFSCHWLTEEYDSDERDSGDEEKQKVSAKRAITKTRIR